MMKAQTNDALSPEIREVTPKGYSVFKKFSAKAERETDEGSVEDPFIFYIENSFHTIYHEMETLGEGTSGVVKRCVKISNNEEFAVKIINFRGDEEIKTLVMRNNYH